MPDENILTKYRPQSFDDFIGHAKQIQALKDGLNRHHAFLFSGQLGCGKTSMSRVIASSVGAVGRRVIEIDAASHSGVDDARTLVEMLTGPQLSTDPMCIIIDECASLSKSAWQVLLKPIEEPPAHLYICLCTTEVAKVPDTIKSRCLHTALRPVENNLLEEFIAQVAEAEGWLDKIDGDMLLAIITESNGSVRQALANLSIVVGAGSQEVLPAATKFEIVTNMAKRLSRDGNIDWPSHAKLLRIALENGDAAESAAAVGRYLLKMLLDAKDPNTAGSIAETALNLSAIGNDRTGEAVARMALVYLAGV